MGGRQLGACERTRRGAVEALGEDGGSRKKGETIEPQTHLTLNSASCGCG